MRSSVVSRKFSYRPGRAAVAAASEQIPVVPFYVLPQSAQSTPQIDQPTVALSAWVVDNFETLECDDIAELLIYGRAQFGRDS